MIDCEILEKYFKSKEREGEVGKLGYEEPKGGRWIETSNGRYDPKTRRTIKRWKDGNRQGE